MPLTATDVTRSCNRRPVLAGVTFTLQPGERALLLIDALLDRLGIAHRAHACLSAKMACR